jgi:hypothetical protein
VFFDPQDRIWRVDPETASVFAFTFAVSQDECAGEQFFNVPLAFDQSTGSVPPRVTFGTPTGEVRVRNDDTAIPGTCGEDIPLVGTTVVDPIPTLAAVSPLHPVPAFH